MAATAGADPRGSATAARSGRGEDDRERGGARPGGAGRAGRHADADDAEAPLEDVDAVRRRRHPGAEALPRGGLRARSPAQVLADEERAPARVPGAADPLRDARARRRDVGEERAAYHPRRVAPRRAAEPRAAAQTRQPVGAAGA